MNVLFITGTHEIGPRSRRAGKSVAAPIVVEDGCWIGAGAILMPGVVVGSGCVIGAGSLVTSDCRPGFLYVGSPAVAKRDLK
nr:DapH/DapD/GlmU-related protein [Rhodococcus sp. 1168]